MKLRKSQPALCGSAAFFALTSIAITPALAAPDRSLCNDGTAPTLQVATTEFSRTITTDADDAIELQGRKLEFASSENAGVDSGESEQVDAAGEETADSQQTEEALPADSGPLVHKRQMYRRDI